MTLVAGQKAFMPARLGVMRLGASRLGWYQPWIKVYLNGVLATSARVSGATITDELNHAPNTAERLARLKAYDRDSQALRDRGLPAPAPIGERAYSRAGQRRAFD